MKKPVDMFREWLVAANIPFEEDSDNTGTCFSVERGYVGFIASVSFDANGNLENIEAFE